MVDPNFQNHFGDIGFVLNIIKNGSYVGIFLLSMLVSYVVPLPEAIFLLLIGFLARKAGFGLEAAIIVSVVGTVIGDNLLYRLSFFGNKYVERFNRKMRANKLIQYENLAIDNIGKTIFFLRFITGVRFFGPVISGTLRASWKKFFIYNAIATTLHSIIFILLGFYFHKKIIPLIAEVEIARNALLFSSVLIVGILLKIFSKKQRKI
ncbi:MAG: Membrane-associated protein, SNARE-like protein [Parcubacteria group bacterium GW2011_GWD2_38_11]|nr:MAG: Membrane-associated protein, SNARE-like protein [Parcubacteria group bacterium GW2011_GWD2_38_11]